MNLLKAVFHHAWLAITLKHDGTGMPTQYTGAIALVATYSSLLMANLLKQQPLSAQDLIAIVFIAQLYVFTLRNRLIGLIIWIGIIANAMMLLAQLVTGLAQTQLFFISIFEYVMVFSAIINIVKQLNTKHY